mmetsp:Transcript_22104/g.51542  ORF Transcript_22104/g.51542 Transcript_22104/m.51542 type:complete len:229 (+) Transcript_22104:85-771(+)
MAWEERQPLCGLLLLQQQTGKATDMIPQRRPWAGQAPRGAPETFHRCPATNRLTVPATTRGIQSPCFSPALHSIAPIQKCTRDPLGRCGLPSESGRLTEQSSKRSSKHSSRFSFSGRSSPGCHILALQHWKFVPMPPWATPWPQRSPPQSQLSPMLLCLGHLRGTHATAPVAGRRMGERIDSFQILVTMAPYERAPRSHPPCPRLFLWTCLVPVLFRTARTLQRDTKS